MGNALMTNTCRGPVAQDGDYISGKGSKSVVRVSSIAKPKWPVCEATAVMVMV